MTKDVLLKYTRGVSAGAGDCQGPQEPHVIRKTVWGGGRQGSETSPSGGDWRGLVFLGSFERELERFLGKSLLFFFFLFKTESVVCQQDEKKGRSRCLNINAWWGCSQLSF